METAIVGPVRRVDLPPSRPLAAIHYGFTVRRRMDGDASVTFVFSAERDARDARLAMLAMVLVAVDVI